MPLGSPRSERHFTGSIVHRGGHDYNRDRRIERKMAKELHHRSRRILSSPNIKGVSCTSGKKSQPATSFYSFNVGTAASCRKELLSPPILDPTLELVLTLLDFPLAVALLVSFSTGIPKS